MNLLLKNATYIDWKTLSFTEADILVQEGDNGKIKLYYPGEADESGVEILDCSGKFVTKGFANGHHHVYSALARGMPAPPKIPQNFHEILQYIWWRLDKALDLEMIEASALFTAMECAKNGVTFVIDHHASPSAVEGSLETIAKDIVYHFPRRGYLGKGLMTSVDKFTAVKMYDKVQYHWKAEIKTLRGQPSMAREVQHA